MPASLPIDLEQHRRPIQIQNIFFCLEPDQLFWISYEYLESHESLNHYTSIAFALWRRGFEHQPVVVTHSYSPHHFHLHNNIVRIKDHYLSHEGCVGSLQDNTYEWNVHIKSFEAQNTSSVFFRNPFLTIENTSSAMIATGNIQTPYAALQLEASKVHLKKIYKHKKNTLCAYAFANNFQNAHHEHDSIYFEASQQNTWLADFVLAQTLSLNIYYENKWFKTEKILLLDILNTIKSKRTLKSWEIEWKTEEYQFIIQITTQDQSTIGSIEEDLDESLVFSYFTLCGFIEIHAYAQGKKISVHRTSNGLIKTYTREKNPYIPIQVTH